MTKKINEKHILKFKEYLLDEEKSEATMEKYIRDIYKFYHFLEDDKTIDKTVILEYKNSLTNQYKTTSINSMLVAINTFLSFLGLDKCKVKSYKIQKRVFCDQNKELTKQEYRRLLEAAKEKDNERLYILLQTICATGIRVSEHRYITVEAVKQGRAVVNNKGKVREIYISKKLKKVLVNYCKKKNIKEGSIFVTKNKTLLDRSNIWKMMKRLCKSANVNSSKVFPHNLRHLFAFTYYSIEKDLVKLAGILGHYSIETTRIYAMTNGHSCNCTLSKMDLVI